MLDRTSKIFVAFEAGFRLLGILRFDEARMPIRIRNSSKVFPCRIVMYGTLFQDSALTFHRNNFGIEIQFCLET
jgi:hypothetical protein